MLNKVFKYKKTLDEIKTEYIKQVNPIVLLYEEFLPVDLYRAYKIVKNYVFN